MKRTWFLACLAIVCASRSAAAQTEAAAEALFDKGLADLQAERYETGCPAIEESYRLDPRPGSLFTLATCYAKAGKIASASARYTDYLKLFESLTPAQKAAQKGREQAAADAKAELAPQVPELTIHLSPGAPADTVVRRDGIILGQASLGLPLPTDPGEHLIRAEAPGAAPKEFKVTLARGEKKDVTIEPGAREAAGPIAPPPKAGGPPKALAYAALGVGAAGVGLGAITGILALVKKGVVSDNCKDHDCNATGKAAADSGKTFAVVSTIGFGLGLAGAGAGVVLLLMQPKPAAPKSAWMRPTLSPSPRGDGVSLGLRGGFW